MLFKKIKMRAINLREKREREREGTVSQAKRGPALLLIV